MLLSPRNNVDNLTTTERPLNINSLTTYTSISQHYEVQNMALIAPINNVWNTHPVVTSLLRRIKIQ